MKLAQIFRVNDCAWQRGMEGYGKTDRPPDLGSPGCRPLRRSAETLPYSVLPTRLVLSFRFSGRQYSLGAFFLSWGYFLHRERRAYPSQLFYSTVSYWALGLLVPGFDVNLPDDLPVLHIERRRS